MEKKLYRIPGQGVIAGVCAGIAQYFAIDVTIVRVLAVISIFVTSGFALLIYLVMVFLLPVKRLEKDGVEVLEPRQSGGGMARNSVGLVLVIIGLWFLGRAFLPDWFRVDWQVLWPVLLIIIGVLIIVRGGKRRG